MTEYFVVLNTEAAPFVSDTVESFQIADSPAEAALKAITASWSAFSLAVYKDANAYKKGEQPLIKWLSRKATDQQKAQKY